MKYRPFPVVAVGDVHGNLEVLRRCLRDLGFIDGSDTWSGGTRHLVQLGDIIDRGPDSLAALRFVRRLQQEAASSGGTVDLLVGNHECMALMAGAGSYRLRMSWMYNGSDSDYVEWAGGQAEGRNWPYPEEFYELFAPGGEFGKFIGTWRGALRIGDFAFIHAGLPLDYKDDLASFNAELSRIFSDPSELIRRGESLTTDTILGTKGPFWMRRFDKGAIERQLDRWGASTVVVGHTIGDGIRRSLDGMLIQIDIGMCYRGSWAALGLDDAGMAWALIEGSEAIPLTGREDMLVPVSLGALPQTVAAAPSTHRFGPGDVAVLYRSSDGSYARYLMVQRVEEFHGSPGYHGIFIDRSGDELEATLGGWPAEMIDRLGRPAGPDDREAIDELS